MNPLFTIHAGEFVFGEHVEKKFKSLRLWIPTKDTGVDFLITSKDHRKVLAVQVKMSRDYRPQFSKTEYERVLRAAGWFVFSHKALEESKADLWSLILIFHERKSKPVFINIPPKKLLEKLVDIHGEKPVYHLYPWVAQVDDGLVCIEGRGMKSSDKQMLSRGEFDSKRDLGVYYDDWAMLESLSLA